jgi:hypothetical protein
LLIFGDEAAQIYSASKTIVEEGLPEEMLPLQLSLFKLALIWKAEW